MAERLNDVLQQLVFPEAVNGGVRGRSSLTNASAHHHQPIVLKLDIRSFFNNVTTDMVERAFRTRCKCTSEVAHILAQITTPGGCLPQGSPPSPVIANLAIEPLIERLAGLAHQHGARFTQYVDDTTISGPAHLTKLENLCVHIIRSAGFDVKPEKVGCVGRAQEQLVTGVRVNHGADVPTEMLKAVTAEIDTFRNGGKALTVSLSSLQGKVRYIEQLNPGAGRRLRRRLTAAAAIEAPKASVLPRP